MSLTNVFNLWDTHDRYSNLHKRNMLHLYGKNRDIAWRLSNSTIWQHKGKNSFSSRNGGTHFDSSKKLKRYNSFKIWSWKNVFVSQLTYPTARTLLNSLLHGHIFLPFWKELQAKSDALLYLGSVYNYFCWGHRFRMILLSFNFSTTVHIYICFISPNHWVN